MRVDTSARRVDVGELAEADYQPGRRLLGAFGFVGDPPVVKIDVLRHPGYRLYPAIVEGCALDTNLSADGQSQTQARFKLRTKAVYLQVKLPAGAELWSAELDGVPLKPQREDDRVLMDVPAGKADAAQTLQIVYAAPVGAVALRGTVDMLAPKLLLARRAVAQEAVEVAAGRSRVAIAPARRIRSGPGRRHGRHRRHPSSVAGGGGSGRHPLLSDRRLFRPAAAIAGNVRPRARRHAECSSFIEQVARQSAADAIGRCRSRRRR